MSFQAVRKIKGIAEAFTKIPEGTDTTALLKGFAQDVAQWWSSMDYNRNSVADESPWITFSAIRFLEGYLKPNMEVFEFGSGGSTLFFRKRVKHVTSIEHHREWFEVLSKHIKELPVKNTTLMLIEPEKDAAPIPDSALSEPVLYRSSDGNYRTQSFRSYASAIDRYEDGKFDLVTVDGRARNSCFLHALKKVKVGGYLMLDNSERNEYGPCFKEMQKLKWEKVSFTGLIPYTSLFSRTTFWKRTQ